MTGMALVYQSMSTFSLSSPESIKKTNNRSVSMTARLLRSLVKVERTLYLASTIIVMVLAMIPRIQKQVRKTP